MNDMESTKYISIGNLADQAGVTIRTLQFYDQKGLLKPSIKGSRNRRFYTPEDQERLYAILCYKYMGLSLDEIKEKLDSGARPGDISEALKSEAQEMQKAISDHMKRYAIIKDLESISGKTRDPESWIAYSEMIDFIKVKWEMIWEFNKAFENGSLLDESPTVGTDEMKQYYSLMTEALRLINEGTPPEDDAMMEVIDRYTHLSPDPSLISVDPDIMRIGSLDASDFWVEIKDYMHKASEHYKKVKSR